MNMAHGVPAEADRHAMQNQVLYCTLYFDGADACAQNAQRTLSLTCVDFVSQWSLIAAFTSAHVPSTI